jgi:hypothetical protein
MAGISAEHEAALASLEQLRHELNNSLENGGRASSGDLQTRIDLREQQLKELGNQLRRVNQELIRTEAARQQVALERRQAGDEIETLRAQVVSSRARLAQVVSAHEQEKSALVRQLVALMPAAGVPGAAKPVSIGMPTGVLTGAAPPAAGAAVAPAGPGTFSAAASLAGAAAGTSAGSHKRAAAHEAGGQGSDSRAAPGAGAASASGAPVSAAPAGEPSSPVAAVATPAGVSPAAGAAGDAGMQAAVQAGIAAALAAVRPPRA